MFFMAVKKMFFFMAVYENVPASIFIAIYRRQAEYLYSLRFLRRIFAAQANAFPLKIRADIIGNE